MFSNDPLDRGESYAGALKFLIAVKPLKCSEKFIGVFRVESCAVVPNENYCSAIDYRLVDLYHGWVTSAAIFDGVRQKIREHLLDQSWVAIHRWQRAYTPVDLPVRGVGLEIVENILNQQIQGSRFQNHAATV